MEIQLAPMPVVCRTLDAGALAAPGTDSHKEMEVDLVLSGALALEGGEALYTLGEGDILVLPPNLPHRAHPAGGMLELQSLTFDPAALQSTGEVTRKYIEPILAGRLCAPGLIARDSFAGAQVARSMQAICEALAARAAGWELAVSGELYFLLYHLYRLGGRLQPPAQDPAAGGVRQVLDYIAQHLDEPLGVEQLARISGYSPSHLMHVFGRMIHTPIRQYVLAMRLERARLLLEEGGTPVAQVAAQVGFDNPSYFIKVFKRRYGVTPAALRRMEK